MTNRILFSIALAVALASTALAAPKASPESVGLESAKLAKIGEAMKQKISDGRMIGGFGLVARHDKVAYFEVWGQRNREANLPMTHDTIVRMFSMSKPITSVGIMILVEEGKLSLSDPVSKFIPQLGGLEVLVDGKRIPSNRDITISDLLTHTSGLTYGFFANDEVDMLYRKSETHKTKNLTELMDALGKLPLKYQPGERWNYSYSTDVLGRVIEVISGQSLDEYLEQRIFNRLDMNDTGFHVSKSAVSRLARIYTPDENDGLVHATPEIHIAAGRRVRDFTNPTTFFSGGGGLAGTTGDYLRIALMLLDGGGKIISKESVDLMMQDHQPRPDTKFGLGLGITPAPGKSGNLYGWGGAAGTRFWLDPERDMVTIFGTQLYPGGGKRKAELRDEFLKLVYESVAE